jgi:thioesterase domain-containing protein
MGGTAVSPQCPGRAGAGCPEDDLAMQDLALIDFLEQLRLQDIHLRVEGDELRCSGAPGRLSPEMRACLAERKPQIIAFLKTGRHSSTCLVKIKPGGHKLPLFVLPAHDVDVYDWVRLAHHFDPQRPLLALEPPGLDGLESPCSSLESLASRLTRDMRAHQPQGPYHLAGYCSGGMVAYEMAQQLLQQGQQVAFLGLLETPSPRAYGCRGQAMVWLRVRRWRLRGHLRQLAAMSVRGWPGYIGSACRRLGHSLARKWAWLRWRWAQRGASPSAETVPAVNLDCVESYRPRPYEGRLHFFFCNRTSYQENFSDQHDWLGWARGGAVSLLGPDSCWHYDMLLAAYAPAFADQLTQALECC